MADDVGNDEVVEHDEYEAPEDGAEDESGEDDEVVVSIGDESPASDEEPEQEPAPKWVGELRKQYRELKRENSELKAKATPVTAETKPAALGKKPTLADHDYDAEVYEQELSKWFELKREHEAEQAKRLRAQEDAQKEWQGTLDTYSKAKTSLKVKDFEDAEDVAKESLSATQQGIILQGADNSAIVIYALGKNPKKAKELASISDPVKFAFAVAKLEKELKVTNRKAPPPEKTVSGNGSISAAVTGSNIERLKTKAQQTGDWDEYFSAKRKLKK